MTAGAPWSVKGIDAKAREVAKDLARRSGMTLGEWLNQMILEGEDVGAMISRERERTSPPAQRFAEPAPERYPETYAEPLVRRRPSVYRETQNDVDPQAPRRPAAYSSASQPLTPPPLTSRDLRRRSIFADEPAFEGRPRYDKDEDYSAASGEMNRVARALESLGARIEGSEGRSANAVRGVSSAVESLLGRLERSEAAHAETREQLHGRLEETSQGLQSTFERHEENQGALLGRLEQAERLIDAQAERLEGLSGHVRDERERIARVETQIKSPQVQETVRVVEGALGKLANQLYEGEQRTRDTMKDVRQDMVGLSHRLTQIELKDPDIAIQGALDKVVTKMAQRLETAEAQTSGAIKALEQAFITLDARLGRAEERGDVTDPESVQSLTRLANDLWRRVEDSRTELLNALNERTHATAEEVLRALGQRVEQSEKRSAAAIEKLGQDVLRIADTLGSRMNSVETAQSEGLSRVGGEVRRVAETVEQRFGRSEGAHAQALERLGGEIARISERLTLRLAESERRTAQVAEGVGGIFERHRDETRNELADRIRQSEDRTAKLLDEARARIDQKLAHVQTRSLLSETVARPAARSLSSDLPNPFGPKPVLTPAPVVTPEPEKTPFSQLPGGFDAAPSSPFDDDDIDDNGDDALELNDPAPVAVAQAVIAREDDLSPDFDPFAEDDLEADLVPAPEQAAYSAPESVRETLLDVTTLDDDDDDSDPFADIEVSRKTAPKADATYAASNTFNSSVSHQLDNDDDGETLMLGGQPISPHSPVGQALGLGQNLGQNPGKNLSQNLSQSMNQGLVDEDDAGVSVSTRDALAAARAAVRASMAGGQADQKGGLGLKYSPSHGRPESRSGKPGKGKGAKESTFMSAFKASAVAAAVVGVGAGGMLLFRTGEEPTVTVVTPKKPPMAATAIITPDSAPPESRSSALLRAEYDSATQSLKARAPGAVDKMLMVANQGYAPAQYTLSGIYRGESGLMQPDLKQARLWTQRAADGGVADAMYNLGLLYYTGDGGPQNGVTAAMWFRKAAERGVTASQYNLGLLYEQGSVMPLDLTKAYTWFRIAAKSGDKDAIAAAAAIEGKISESQRQTADEAVASFVPITDGPTVAGTQAGPKG